MKYFAYGSNLSLPRLQARIAIADCYGVYHLPGHSLRFHKQGQDGSAKCDAWYTGDDEHLIYGLVYEISAASKQTLDRIEGLGQGYAEKQVLVLNSDGHRQEALTYCATELNPTLQPFHWYKAHVLNGAIEAGFPEYYVQALRAVSSVEDPDASRAVRQMAIYTE